MERASGQMTVWTTGGRYETTRCVKKRVAGLGSGLKHTQLLILPLWSWQYDCRQVSSSF